MHTVMYVFAVAGVAFTLVYNKYTQAA